MKKTTLASASVTAVTICSALAVAELTLTPTQIREAAPVEGDGSDEGFRDGFLSGGDDIIIRQTSSSILDTENGIEDNLDGDERSRIGIGRSERNSDPNNLIDRRRTQQNAASQNTNFLSSNPTATIQAIENHIFSPEVQDSIQSIFQSRVVYEGSIHTFPSFRYTFEGFWKNWKRMLTTGISTGKSNNNGNSSEKLLLFGGDNNYHNATIQFSKLISEPPIQIAGFEYGLANMAAFLSQVMVDGIYDDTCDELNVQISPGSANEQVASLSNACGQYGLSYQDMTCPNNEKEMECPVSDQMTIISTQSSGEFPMRCGPKGTFPDLEDLQLENGNGRMDSEGCCWWGRGPLSTRGVCNIGKVNYYLGKRAVEEGRAEGTEGGIFGDIDFCATPEAICNAENEDLMWSVAMMEWAERVQTYRSEDVIGSGDSGDDGDGSGNGFVQTRKKKEDNRPFNYDERLIEFVESGMNINDYYPNKKKDDSFIEGVSAIVNRGCHKESVCGIVHNISLRRTAFAKVLSVLRIPIPRKLQVVETALDYLKSKKEGFETNLLQYQELSGSFSPSTRYRFDDFVDALTRVSLPHEFIPPQSKANYYFISQDHSPFYLGDPHMKDGHKYGLGNIALFFANGLDLAIEHDSCDEHNVHPLAFKLPLSNSCGSRGVSFQDMVCDSSYDNDLPDMSCEVDYNMALEAVTSEAAPPFQCAPASQIPFTGYWDLENNVVVADEAYANDNGMVNVEGCCWWGRGILHTKGVCSYGRLNYYLGARAANEGRNSIYPDIDFCLNPEAICSSENSTELQWITGMFDWLDRVQSYDKGGFNYIDELHKFADTGYQDDTFIKSVLSIVQVGCHNPPCASAGCVAFPCDGAYPVDENDGVTKVFRTLLELNLWREFDMTRGGTHEPTPSPTECTNCTETTYTPTLSPMFPTISPTNSPTEPPTFRPSPPPTRAIVNEFALAQEVEKFLGEKRTQIENTIFVSDSPNGKVPSKLYSYDGFLYSLKEASRNGIGEDYFYFGQGKDGGRDYGLVNIASFLAHAMTRGLKWDTCEEINEHAIDDKLPLSNACGQFGKSNGDQICLMSDIPMECPVDPNMSVSQTSVGSSRSPPFFCAPKSLNPFTGYYDPVSDQTISDTPYPNAAGREDVEGCCWWGRGILLTPGVCDIGKFNHLYGLPAFKEGRDSARYNVDFCANPDAFCSNFSYEGTEFNQFSATIDTTDIRYAYGMLYWIDHVQKFSWGFWDYMDRLKRFVDGGMTDESFVDELSDIVLESRHDAPLRKSNFNRILAEVFSLKMINEPTPSEPAGQKKTNPPTRVEMQVPPEEDPAESSISESDEPPGPPILDPSTPPITSNPPAPPAGLAEPPGSLPFANTRVEGISHALTTNALFGIVTAATSLLICLSMM